ncbi:MAG: aminoglycoside phosphotransferase, partial [Bacteroidetes bacterium]
LSAARPGEGNMNYTLRIQTNTRSFILKQSRGYVEKYPSIAAPRDRALTEGHFYGLVRAYEDLRSYMPELYHSDTENALLMIEDLGESSDFTSLYQPGNHLQEAEIEALMAYLSLLHEKITLETVPAGLPNRAMRALNAEHIFHHPLMEDNGFSLDTVTPGLQQIAMRYKTDAALKSKVAELGNLYLTDGSTLLHGDYYPGSWLRTTRGVQVIDPEFCFFGPPEFDLSVAVAHMMMALQPEEATDSLLKHYRQPAGFDERLLMQLAGVEIIRRLIGLAQLPLSLNLEEKSALLEEAVALVLQA